MIKLFKRKDKIGEFSKKYYNDFEKFKKDNEELLNEYHREITEKMDSKIVFYKN